MKLTVKAYNGMLVQAVINHKLTPRKAKRLALAAALALTSSVVHAETTKFAQHEYHTVLERSVVLLGPPSMTFDTWDCSAYKCRGRSAYWYKQGEYFVRLTNTIGDHRRGEMQVVGVCPPNRTYICENIINGGPSHVSN